MRHDLERMLRIYFMQQWFNLSDPQPEDAIYDSERWRKINRARSRTRARCEHPFRVIKQLWGFDRTRYRGIAKHLARVQTMFALTNLYVLRHQLLATGPQVRLVID